MTCTDYDKQEGKRATVAQIYNSYIKKVVKLMFNKWIIKNIILNNPRYCCIEYSI